MINILVRTSNRPTQFKRMFNSVLEQRYTDWRIIIAYDNDEALSYIPPSNFPKSGPGRKSIKIKVTPNTSIQFPWNLYCNELKDQVEDGHFFYLDDDDYLKDKFVLESISKHLKEGEGTICQFMRGKVAKPQKVYMDRKEIISGKIGGSCLFLHHSQKNVADWDAGPAADYRWIKAVSEKVKLNWVPIPVVVAGGKGLGKI